MVKVTKISNIDGSPFCVMREIGYSIARLVKSLLFHNKYLWRYIFYSVFVDKKIWCMFFFMRMTAKLIRIFRFKHTLLHNLKLRCQKNSSRWISNEHSKDKTSFFQKVFKTAFSSLFKITKPLQNYQCVNTEGRWHFQVILL